MHKHSFFALRPISSFTLMAGRKNQDGLVILLEAVERHVVATATEDEQLAQVTLDGATDQRVTNQWIYRFRNQLILAQGAVAAAAPGSISIRKSVALSRSASARSE